MTLISFGHSHFPLLVLTSFSSPGSHVQIIMKSIRSPPYLFSNQCFRPQDTPDIDFYLSREGDLCDNADRFEEDYPDRQSFEVKGCVNRVSWISLNRN
jgi:hypothetical protein